MATGTTPTTTPTPGTVVHYDITDPYGDEGVAVVEHAGLVVAVADDGRIRVRDLGPIGSGTAEFGNDAVRVP